MTILELITKAAAASAGLVRLMDDIEAKAPDAKPQIDALRALLAQAVDPANLANLVVVVGSELRDIAQGRIAPKSHPSDAI